MGERKSKRDTMIGCLLYTPQPGTEPATWNQTSDLLLCGMPPNHLSHTTYGDFILFYSWVIFHCISITLPLYPFISTDGHLGCFHMLAIVNNAAKNIGMHVSFKLVFWVSSDKYPEVELLGPSLSYYRLCFKVYLVCCKYCYLSFFACFHLHKISFREVHSMSKDRPFVWKSYWKWLGWAENWVAGGLRESSGWGNGVSQVDGDSDMAPACVCKLDRGGPQPRTNGTFLYFCLGESYPLQPPAQSQTIQFLPVCPCDFPAVAPVLELRARESLSQ